MRAYCKECESEVQVEATEGALVMCVECGEEFAPAAGKPGKGAAAGKLQHFSVAQVLAVEELKDGLKKLSVDVGGGAKLTVVTNAKHMDVSARIVVAREGAVVPAGKTVGDDPDAFVVKATSVGGVKSQGMVCDCPMLGWVGGAKGVAQTLDASFKAGDVPPETRPARK